MMEQLVYFCQQRRQHYTQEIIVPRADPPRDRAIYAIEAPPRPYTKATVPNRIAAFPEHIVANMRPEELKLNGLDAPIIPNHSTKSHIESSRPKIKPRRNPPPTPPNLPRVLPYSLPRPMSNPNEKQPTYNKETGMYDYEEEKGIYDNTKGMVKVTDDGMEYHIDPQGEAVKPSYVDPRILIPLYGRDHPWECRQFYDFWDDEYTRVGFNNTKWFTSRKYKGLLT